MKKADYIVILILVIIAFFLFRECNLKVSKELIDNVSNDSLKTEIKAHSVKKDSIHKEVKKHDSVRVVYLTKWRTAKGTVLHDTVYKHDTIIKQLIVACDSALIKDSVLIYALKTEVKQDSLIIDWYKKVAYNDSITIKKLKKKQLKYFGAGVVLGAGVASLKK